MWVNGKMESLLSRNFKHSEQRGIVKKLLGIAVQGYRMLYDNLYLTCIKRDETKNGSV